MNERIRDFEKESGLEIYGLGAKRDPWENAMEKFTTLIVDEVLAIINNPQTYNSCVYTTFDADRADGVARQLAKKIKEHFKDTQ